MNVGRSFCNFPLPTEMLETKSNKSVRNLNLTRACWDISISVLAKRFSFVVIVILLDTLVKIVRSHHCLFVCCSFFSFLYFCYHSWWIKMFKIIPIENSMVRVSQFTIYHWRYRNASCLSDSWASCFHIRLRCQQTLRNLTPNKSPPPENTFALPGDSVMSGGYFQCGVCMWFIVYIKPFSLGK